MTVTDLILKKRNGGVLSADEIKYFIGGYVEGVVPDYQVSALLMSVWFKGMTGEETAALTMAMMHSGDLIDLSLIPGVKVDKHSTGGVADTTTLVAAPVVAACGGKVAKMSGRGLGHTGGTLDKLESIPGFKVEQDMGYFRDTVSRIGLSIIGQTARLVPADRMMYALRDVTGTVDSIPLIASSIMSKKLAAGSDAIVLDVKTGSGAFMKDRDAASELAREMVSIGTHAGKNTLALVSDMSQPLGNAIGNALEVQEAIEILQGFHPGDLRMLSLELAAQMLVASGLAADRGSALSVAEKSIEDGSACEKLGDMIEAQDGDRRVCDDIMRLPRAKGNYRIEAAGEGFVSAIDTDEIGMAALLLGAGRQVKSDVIDPATGIWMEKRLGDEVRTGDVLAVFHVNDEKNLEDAIVRFQQAFHYSDEPCETPPLIHALID